MLIQPISASDVFSSSNVSAVKNEVKVRSADTDWVKEWLIFNVGRSICSKDSILLADKATWESANNSCWHDVHTEPLLRAFDSLVEDDIIVLANESVRLSSQGETRWEELFLPDWKRSYCEYSLKDNMIEITSPSLETCMRVFGTATFLRLIELDSIRILPEEQFRPLYWKRIDSAWTLRFQYRNHPSITYPIMLICSDLVADLSNANGFRRIQKEYRSLLKEIEAIPEVADQHLRWYKTPEKNTD